jgi:thioredoxin reductase (NADPH)
MSEPTFSLPPTSALDAQSQAFPKLTSAQIERARAFGQVRPVAAGDILFDVGDTRVSMFILLSGRMEIVQPGPDGETF